jgi:predicted secreted protein
MRFASLASGQTSLCLVYRRSWEREIAPRKSFAVIVVVK